MALSTSRRNNPKWQLSLAARDASCKCPRMSFVWFLVCYLLSAFLPAENKWNFDCSTYVFNGIGQGDKIRSLANESDIHALLKEVDRVEDENVEETATKSSNRGSKTRSISNALPFAIKVGALINAAGEKGPCLMIIAIPNMPENEFHFEKINALSFTCEIGQIGYLYFCKTRCGTKEMWKHVFKNCIFPCIKKSNEHHNKKDKDGNLFRNFFSTDGEDIIISNAYENDLVELMEQIRIDYGRVVAGSTAIHNAFDRWVQFRLSKYFLKKWRLEGKVITNETLRLNLENSFKEFKLKYSNINYRLKESIIQGVITLVHVYEETMKPDQVRHAFLCCGQHFQPDAVAATVSFDK